MEITRGDYKTFRFERKNKNQEVIMEKPEKMYLTIKNNSYEKKALIQKTLDDGIEFEDGVYRVTFLPEDTDNLSFGDYIYDIEIINNGKPKTIKVDEFVIDKEVTHKENEV
jgi:hypothetical protein